MVEMRASPARSGSSEMATGVLAFGLLLAALAMLIYRSVKLGGYFPDDAYITFRFAEHLAEGFGIVWNQAGPPVEGSTSFLQTILLATAIGMGFPTAVAAYAINGICVIVLLWVLYRCMGQLGVGFGIGAAIAYALFLSGFHFTVHVNSGMETVLSMTLLSASFLTALALLNRPGALRCILLALVNFLALWCRPDAAPFIVAQGAVLSVVAFLGWRRRGEMALAQALVVSFGLLILLGVAFLIWKMSYFGYILPNSFYVKATDPWAFRGLAPVTDFLQDQAARVAFLLPFLIFVDWRGLLAARNGTAAARISLLLIPPSVFLFYNTTVLHLVGFNYRFEYPVAPFFWIAAAWLLAAGGAAPRLEQFMARWFGPAFSATVPAGLGLVMLASSIQVDRALHRQWFRPIQVLHYEPIADALRQSGAGAAGTLVFDSAGFIPYRSGFSLIDPVGLTDNVLSGREPITLMQREEYIWGAKPDVYLGPVPPAGPGATGWQDDPVIATEYVQRVLLSGPVFEGYGRMISSLSDDEIAAALSFRMRELRDNWIAVGEVPYPFGASKGYTHFIYVRRDSPLAEELVSAIEAIVARRVDEFDFTLGNGQ